MSTSTTTPSTSMETFTATTTRAGRLTMIAGLLVSLSGPLYLVLFVDLGITASALLTAFAAVAGTFFIIWLVEPVTYYPILGPGAMYQAFMIGNISNKLLPSAVVAQQNVGARPGTDRGSLAASMAICGAAVVHIVSLVIFVGLLGTWLLSVTPETMLEVVRTYVIPAVFGAVAVQAIITVRRLRPVLFALAVAMVVQLGIVPMMPGLGYVATGICVLATILLTWFLRPRDRTRQTSPHTLHRTK